MRTAISPLELFEPRSVTEALRLLREQAPVLPMAGCTDLYVSVNSGTLAERRFLNLWHFDTLRRIEQRAGVLSIGALATFADIIGSPLTTRRIPMLVAASR